MIDNYDIIIIGTGAGGGTIAQALSDTSARILIVERGGHGFGLGRDEESGRWKDAFLAWLARLP